MVPLLSDLVVVGARGQVGRLIARRARPTRSCSTATRSTSPTPHPSTGCCPAAAGTTVINCAAHTAVDAAETDVDAAEAINVTGPANLARATAATGAWLVHVSTDYVFDGAAPSGGVDRSNRRTCRRCAAAVGLRPHELAGNGRPVPPIPGRPSCARRGCTPASRAADFVATMRRLEAERSTVSVVDDQVGSPTYAADLAQSAPRRGGHAVRGRCDAARDQCRACSWFELARAVFAGIGADSREGAAHHHRRLPASRPAPRMVGVVVTVLEDAGLTPLRDWRSALTAALAADGVPQGG